MENLNYSGLRNMSAADVRHAIRQNQYNSHTAGLASGFLQANLAILPKEYAFDFMRFCQRNSKPCPLVGVSDTGDAALPTLGHDIDIRSDVPAYNVYLNGELAYETNDISDIWDENLVAFALGCSFTFEHALQKAGIAVWHIDHNSTVPMFRTNIPTIPAGPFDGPLVVTMRAIPQDQVGKAIDLSRRFPLAHGAPIHIGDPSEIGIAEIDHPDWGEPAPLLAGTVPVFWACGVTPQVAIQRAGVPLCVTHKPGHMLVTDIQEDSETPVLGAAGPSFAYASK